MGDLNSIYDPKALPPKETLTVIPKGLYTATAEDAEVVKTKDGTGAFVKIVWRIEGPSYAGAVIFDRINIANRSLKAQEIGRQQMSQLQVAVGFYLEDTSQLIGKRCQLKVEIEKQDVNSQYEPGNFIRDYMPLSESQPGTAPDAKPASSAMYQQPVSAPESVSQAYPVQRPSPQPAVTSIGTGKSKSWQRG